MISMKLWNWEHWAGVGLLSVPLRYPGGESTKGFLVMAVV